MGMLLGISLLVLILIIAGTVAAVIFGSDDSTDKRGPTGNNFIDWLM